MTEHKLVYGFGSKIEDINVMMTPELWEVFAKEMEEAKVAINKQAAEEKTDPVVSIITEKDHEDRYYRYIEKFVEEHKDELTITRQTGGSIPNTFAATKLTLTKEEVENTDFYQTVASNATTYNIVNPTTGRKTMATYRPRVEGLELTPDDKEAIKKASVIVLPKSSFNGYIEIVEQIVGIVVAEKLEAAIFPTFHGSDGAIYATFMFKIADAICGDHGESSLPKEYEPDQNEFRQKGIQVVTQGKDGLIIYSPLFDQPGENGSKHFDALPVKPEEREKDASNIGAGNVVEAQVVKLLLRHGKAGFARQDLEDAADWMNAGGGVGTMFAGSTLTEKWVPRIEERYVEISANRKRSELENHGPYKNPTLDHQ